MEFVDKAVAKNVAKSLNTTIIGGNKNSYYHDDMWNIKYLPKFKWNHLTERIGKLFLFFCSLVSFLWVNTFLASYTYPYHSFQLSNSVRECLPCSEIASRDQSGQAGE